ncbi:MAG: hypothetical protein ACFFD4_14460 [Candidatus Odinarchaeota archaeon]
MNFGKKYEYTLLVFVDLIVLIQAIMLANLTSFLLIYSTLLVIAIISNRNVLFKEVDFTKPDEQVLLSSGNQLFEAGKATMFATLLAALNSLMLLFFLPQSFPEKDPFLSGLPGLHLFLFLFIFGVPYVVHQLKGEKLEKLFRELLYLEFKEKTKNVPPEELPAFLFEVSTMEEQKKGRIRSLSEESADYYHKKEQYDQLNTRKNDSRVNYNELMEERTEFFKQYFPGISSLFISPTATLNPYYFSEMLKIRLQKDPELIQLFIARNPGV